MLVSRVVETQTSDIYYDPYDAEIDVDPYPVWRRMREEAPLYYNEPYDFFALSRFDDVEPCLVDWDTYRSGRGSILELIKAEFEIPRGVILFEDPPRHDVHRGVMSRVFTPKKMNAIEPKVREFCARTLDPLVGSGHFDFIHDLGAQMPMRTIGFLLGHPRSGPGGHPGPSRRGSAARRRRRRARSTVRASPTRPRCSASTSTGGPSTPPTTS